MTRRPLAAMLAAGLALGLATPTLAAPSSPEGLRTGYEPHTVRVEYSDLNLSSAKGQKRLERRIRSAVREVCGAPVPATGTRLRTPEVARCMALAQAGALQQYAALTGDTRLGG